MEDRNYKEMYLKLMRSTEAVINLLITAQQECEELYVNASDEDEADNNTIKILSQR